MKNYIINLSDDFSKYAWEIELKGCFEVDIQVFDKLYTFNFYDPIRLKQTIEDDLRSNQYFFCENLVVLPKVSLDNIEKFIENIINTPYLLSFSTKR
ncbi:MULTISPECIES: hypothetical protein [Acinetobacter]|uniref:Uncharacterized protein n=1 Tax=Acinetobacter calcoaceticus TaxID=471 RepID=A0A446ZGH4_ACICA|nr:MULTISPECIES: hypothetical protein [Acinetobacter]MEB3863872.1 hypothetical protein [Acinetobacter sp. IK31]CAI3159271.1 hypothetical protein MWMV7_MWMV7_03138 [Acinetobacter calcoaceticus]VAX43558.1 Uncharacterised protein [Acinetobacter calcoaceticus]